MNKTIGIISAGAWGTAIGKVVAEKGAKVTMWDFMTDVVKDINMNHTNTKYLPGIKLPVNLEATGTLAEAAGGKDFLIIATPSLYVLNIVKKLIQVPEILEGKTTIGILTKGFIDSGSGPSLIIRSMENYLPGFYKDNLVYISGPSHAEEVAGGKLTGLISASLNGKNSIRFRELLTTGSLMVFSSFDTAGVQTCAAVKNVIAVAFGMLDALKEQSDTFGDNTESLLLAAGLNEIQLIGQVMGSTHPETFTSIAGVGDLDVTCRSRFGRNRRFGSDIIKKNILAPYRDLEHLISRIDDIGYLPEGMIACKYAIRIAEKHKLKLPIVNTVYKILNREEEPFEALNTVLRVIIRGSKRGTAAK